MKILKTTAVLAALFTGMQWIAAQVPDGISYQAVLRDDTNNEISDAPIDVRFGLIIESPTGTLIWEEEHSTVTNDMGLFSLVIGDPSASKTGGTHASYTDINWGAYPVYLKVSILYEGTWKYFDPQLINSVPFALKSKTAEDDADKAPDNELIETLVLNGTSLEVTEAGDTKAVDLNSFMDSPFSVNADTVTLMDKSLSIGSPNPGRSKLAITSQDDLSEDALFEVKRSDGQTIFAVYNEGVRIYLPTESATKGPKGGFAIGGFDRTKGEYTEDYVWVTPDSIRMYFDKTPEGIKGPKGGFAIGGFDRTKNGVDELMIINADSTRFYIDDTGINKGVKGGFAIGGFDRTKGLHRDFMRVTTDSTRFFVNDSLAGFSVANTQTGVAQSFMDLNKVNSFVGHESGQKTEPNFSAFQGRYNSFFGYGAGKDNTSGYGNIFIGHETGNLTQSGSYNVYLGYKAGRSNVAGLSNVFIGYESGVKSTVGYNVYIGQGSGRANSDGTENTYVGAQAGIEDGEYSEYGPGYASGYSNTYIGYRSGAKNYEAGHQNTYLGARSGSDGKGSGNVFIGFRAGQSVDDDNLLFIENSNSETPLIYGDFTDGQEEVIINGNFSYTGQKGALSDFRYKENIEPLGDVMNSIGRIRGVYFTWKEDEYPDMIFSEGRQIGIIAQDIEKIYPELVRVTSKGYRTVDYEKLSVILLEGIKQQQKEIEDMKNEIEELRNMYNRINEMK